MTDVDAMIAEQRALAGAVVCDDAIGPVQTVAGIDVGYAGDDSIMIAAAAVLDAATLAVVEIAIVTGVPRIAYLPGLFSFRELPIALEALDRLGTRPDLVVCDAQGIAHPRRLGLASHLGVVADIPTIGCAKSRLIGTHEAPAHPRGAIAPLIDDGQTIGAALRTQQGVRPLYVSIGHRVSLATACDWILRLSPNYRLPETTRVADHAVREALAAR